MTASWDGVQAPVGDGAGIGEGDAPGAQTLVSYLRAHPAPRVLEVGTLRWEADRPTHHEAWAPHGRWVKADATAGTDVDVVLDAHDMGQVMGSRKLDAQAGRAGGGWDAYVACSVWEHLERPWRAMAAAAAVVRPGGLVYIQTHQTFPLHGYPNDFYRFSDQALRVQAEDEGLVVVVAGYMYPCTIVPPAVVTRWNTAPDVQAFLNVELLARKPGGSWLPPDSDEVT